MILLFAKTSVRSKKIPVRNISVKVVDRHCCYGDPYPPFYFDADSDPDPDPPHWVKLLPYVTDKFFNAPEKLV
jgi:hypothetical protein